jgi:aquaporin NIP
MESFSIAHFNFQSMKKYIAELIGTFALVFCGTGAIIINEESGGTVGHIGIAITFGLIVMAMIYSFGRISGAHLNPAVTIAFSLTGLFPRREIIPYVLSQVSGAFIATLLLKYLFPANENLGATVPSGTEMQSFILEIVLGFFLMMVILFTTQNNKDGIQFAGIMIGFTVLLEAMFAGPITGASMNPARSLSPDIIRGDYSTLWIYLTAPVIGAIGATGFWKYMRSS